MCAEVNVTTRGVHVTVQLLLVSLAASHLLLVHVSVQCRLLFLTMCQALLRSLPCVIHHPSNHHMFRLSDLARSTSLTQAVVGHTTRHPTRISIPPALGRVDIAI